MNENPQNEPAELGFPEFTEKEQINLFLTGGLKKVNTEEELLNFMRNYAEFLYSEGKFNEDVLEPLARKVRDEFPDRIENLRESIQKIGSSLNVIDTILEIIEQKHLEKDGGKDDKELANAT